MTAAVVPFPPRRLRAICILPLREAAGWLVLHGAIGWLHGDYSDAIADAQWLAKNTGLPIRYGARA
jgi:hypothetical protein